jgi:hypothetical protein
MTLDETKLLRHGLFWAVLVAGFWILISIIRSRFAIAIGMILWSALLFVIFYRDAHKKDPS